MAVLSNAAGIFPTSISAKEIVKAQGLDIDISSGRLKKLTDQVICSTDVYDRLLDSPSSPNITLLASVLDISSISRFWPFIGRACFPTNLP
ncbi:hypothetical protein N7540_013028 [Penicillium herquei]|nr:hypothetical protein N7540_013028 [Penicillium herquei]